MEMRTAMKRVIMESRRETAHVAAYLLTCITVVIAR
jgi:hypothetical protein